jgi:small basic protein
MLRSPLGSAPSPMREGRESRPRRLVGADAARRLIACYALIIALVAAVELSLPLAASGGGRMLAPWLEQALFGMATARRILPAWLDAALAMATAFVLTVPTVIVYIRTRSHETFDESLVNTVLVLPSVVTAILVVVQSSLALAFSLAGIVAAVRFRSNVKESRDALYIFAGVAIGFASGVYALDVAATISLLFVLLELYAWRSGLGGYQSRTHALLWGDAPARLARAAVTSWEPRQEPRNGKHATSGDGESDEDARRPGRLVLRVVANDVDDGRHAVEAVLGATAKKWSFRRTMYRGGGTIGLEYQARLRRAHSPDVVRDRVLHEGAPFVTAAEWAT